MEAQPKHPPLNVYTRIITYRHCDPVTGLVVEDPPRPSLEETPGPG